MGVSTLCGASVSRLPQVDESGGPPACLLSVAPFPVSLSVCLAFVHRLPSYLGGLPCGLSPVLTAKPLDHPLRILTGCSSLRGLIACPVRHLCVPGGVLFGCQCSGVALLNPYELCSLYRSPFCSSSCFWGIGQIDFWGWNTGPDLGLMEGVLPGILGKNKHPREYPGVSAADADVGSLRPILCSWVGLRLSAWPHPPEKWRMVSRVPNSPTATLSIALPLLTTNL